MEVQLLAATTKPLETMYVAARTCYSEEGPIQLEKELPDDDTKWNLIKKVLQSGHQSIAEHVNFTFAIEGISRACSHQLVRHRHATYCLDADVLIYCGDHGKERKRIEDIYNMPDRYKKMLKVRCVNENTNEITSSHLKSVIYTGEQEIYEVETIMGYKIRCTKNHRFLLSDKTWAALKDLSIGSKIMLNGILAYKNKEWLTRNYHELNLTIPEIAEKCGVAAVTISSWIKKFNLQKPKGKGMIGRIPPNKGKNKHNYPPMMQTSLKMQGNKNNKGLKLEKNSNWKGDEVKNGHERTYCYYTHSGKCSNCGLETKTHFHHIDKNPFNTDPSNVVELCINCHQLYHHKNLSVIRPDTIKSISLVGIRKTYDIEMEEPYHNFIANGFVVHNSQQSQRYVEIKEDYDLLDLLGDDGLIVNEDNYLERTDLINVLDKYFVWDHNNYAQFHSLLQSLYCYLYQVQAMNLKPEDARNVLPNATKTNLVMTCNLRELIHICNLRLCNRAQSEIKYLVKLLSQTIHNNYSNRITEFLVPSCEITGYCKEAKSCGRKPKK